MKCPFCAHTETQVLDTRIQDDGDIIRRRRRCNQCERRFTTYERVELNFPMIVKKDGSRVDYSAQKLHSSMMLALRKRPVPIDKVEQAITCIEEKLLALNLREIDSEYLGELVMQELKELDIVSYIRFASVYQQFQDLEAFAKAIAEVNENNNSNVIN